MHEEAKVLWTTLPSYNAGFNATFLERRNVRLSKLIVVSTCNGNLITTLEVCEKHIRRIVGI